MAEQPTVPEVQPLGRTLVYGLGISGLSVARYLKRAGIVAEYTDSRSEPPGLGELRDLLPDAKVVPADPTDELLSRIDRIVVSPGIADRDSLLSAARAVGIDIVSDIDLFVTSTQVPIAAITGSNGKSTVATLLAMMCEADGIRARAGANLGEPALDLLTDSAMQLSVLELSSFQLQRCRELPASVAVLLNITPDHLDWHESEREYREAKYRIFREASAGVWNRADPEVQRYLPPHLREISFGMDPPSADEYGITGEDGTTYLARGDRLLMPVSSIALVGSHNHANALAALAAGELIGLGQAAMLKVLREFAGLPHRMQKVREIGGVSYVNDSKATNVAAAMSAVESVDGPVILIAGGQGKGGDFAVLAAGIHEHLEAAILIGEDAPLIADALDGLTVVYRADDMRGAVDKAAAIARAGDTVLLAPACASFDQFENFQQRGTVFCKAVEGLDA